MDSGSGFGQVMAILLGFPNRCSRTCFKPEAVFSSFEDVATVGKTIEECCGHLGIAKHARPFAKAEIGRDDNAGSLVEFAEQME